jgi:LysR family nitrogen assimilation transcriptional regulator
VVPQPQGCCYLARSLNKAAEQVFVAQPALSHHLAALEAELGVPLLLRSSKGVAPTDAGWTLYRHARNIMKQLELTRSAGSSAQRRPNK